tara:strand:+ start:1504 stop:1671 length:168 start_codon:yes stop_codon:yes gene_type:complete
MANNNKPDTTKIVDAFEFIGSIASQRSKLEEDYECDKDGNGSCEQIAIKAKEKNG